jgi:hypothetical protein
MPTPVPILPQDPRSAQNLTSARHVLNFYCVVAARVLIISISTCVPLSMR